MRFWLCLRTSALKLLHSAFLLLTFAFLCCTDPILVKKREDALSAPSQECLLTLRSEVRRLVDPLHSRHIRRYRSAPYVTHRDGGGREPGWRKTVLRVAAIKEHISRGSADVHDLVLNTPANNVERVDARAGIHQTPVPAAASAAG